MLKFIKENWLIAMISGAIGSIITLVIVYHWYSKSISDVITSWIVALCTFVLTVFAWFAYQYATDGYKKQAQINEITKAKTSHKIQIISQISKIINITQEILIEEKSHLQLICDHLNNDHEYLHKDIEEFSKTQRDHEKALTKCVTLLSALQIEIYFFHAALNINSIQQYEAESYTRDIAAFINDVNLQTYGIRMSLKKHIEMPNKISGYEISCGILHTAQHYYSEKCDHIADLVVTLSNKLQSFLYEDIDKHPTISHNNATVSKNPLNKAVMPNRS